MKKTTQNLLTRLCVPAHLMGYEYLADAIEMVSEDKNCIHCITKTIYPAIAKKYGVSSGAIERNIRTVVTHSFENMPSELKCELFGCSFFPGKRKPANSHYIATVAQLLEETK